MMQKFNASSSLGLLSARADTTYDKFANALEVMKKYPKEHKRFKEQLTLMRRNFNRLSKIINKEP